MHQLDLQRLATGSYLLQLLDDGGVLISAAQVVKG